jgi:hypothetical protein
MRFLQFLSSFLTRPKTQTRMVVTFAQDADPCSYFQLQSRRLVVVNRAVYRVVKADAAALSVMPVTFDAAGTEQRGAGANPMSLAWAAIETLHIT